MKLDPILAMGVALLLCGGKKLPELAKGLGQGIKEFKKATGTASEEIRHAIEDPVPVPARRLTPAPAGNAVSRISENADA
jgi:sec-independent protein translocase protein TatA